MREDGEITRGPGADSGTEGDDAGLDGAIEPDPPIDGDGGDPTIDGGPIDAGDTGLMPEPGPPWFTGCAADAGPRELVLAQPTARPLLRFVRPAGVKLMVVGPIAPVAGHMLWTFPTSLLTDGTALKAGAPTNNPIFAVQDQPLGLPAAGGGTWGLRYGDDGAASPSIMRSPEEISGGKATTLSPIALVPSARDSTDARWAFVLEDNSTGTVADRSTWVASVRDDDPPLARESARPVFGTTYGDFYQPAAALFDPTEQADSALNVVGCMLGTAGDFSYPCILVRVPPDRANERDAYTAFVKDPDGTEHWERDLTKATPVFNGSSTLSVSYNPYLQKFVATHSVFGTNDVLLQTAETLHGPWTEAARVRLDAPPGGTGYNIFAREHSALSPSCGQVLVLSYLEATSYVSIFPTAGATVLVTLALE